MLYNQIPALFVLAAFMAQTFSRNIIIADYYANADKYMQHCENKSRPMMHCNGKCQMMKKMRQEEKKDQENPERRSDNKNEVSLSSKSFFASLGTRPLTEIISSTSCPSMIGLPIDRNNDIFHPPGA